MVSVAMVSVAMVSVAMVSVAMVSVAMLSVAMLSVAMVSVAMVSREDGASFPLGGAEDRRTDYTYYYGSTYYGSTYYGSTYYGSTYSGASFFLVPRSVRGRHTVKASSVVPRTSTRYCLLACCQHACTRSGGQRLSRGKGQR